LTRPIDNSSACADSKGTGQAPSLAVDDEAMGRARDLTNVSIRSPRLSLRSFTAADAPESFAESTPTLTRFMGWDPSPSLSAFAEIWHDWLPRMAAGTDLHLVIRLGSTREFLGMAGLHGIGGDEPEIGIWIKEKAHRLGYGREAVGAVIAWAPGRIEAAGFCYPVVVENRPSRRLVESLGGILAGTRELKKPSGKVLDEVVYRIALRRAGPNPVTSAAS
jgi:RimJ/RimL family protein N-acetyltransferase